MSDFDFEGGAPASDSGSSYPASDSSSSYGSESSYGSQSDSSYGQGAPSQDSQTYDVTINGQTQKVPLNELLKGYSRHSDYTQKTQSLAERERVYQAQMQQYESALGELKGFLEDPQRVAQYYEQLQQQYQAQQPLNPDEFVTAQQAQYLLQQQLGQLQMSQQQQLMELQHNIEVQNLTGQYTPQVENKISELKGRFPALNSPRTERMLRMETLNRQPGSLQEAMQVMENVANEINSDLTSILKQGGAPPINPQLANGIEPRGGQGLMPQPQGNFKKVNDIGLRNLVIQDLMNAGPGQRSR